MKTTAGFIHSRSGRFAAALGAAVLFVLASAACGAVRAPSSGQPAQGDSNAEAAPAPAGWATYTSKQCEYSISYPADMQVTNQTPYSQTLMFRQADSDAGARNFVYVSVIGPHVQSMVTQGIYQNEVYNYDPAATDILLNMQVGEKRPVHPVPSVASGFTYERKADTALSGQTAQTYENAQPWEFPRGTKEIRHILSLQGCTYLVGGYVDTTGSAQQGAISEELLNQIVATLRLIP